MHHHNRLVPADQRDADRFRGVVNVGNELCVGAAVHPRSTLTPQGPIWNGEFGPVYDDATDGPEWEKTNESRYGVLECQLDIYQRSRASWSIWLYKGEWGLGRVALHSVQSVPAEVRWTCEGVLCSAFANSRRYRLPGDGVRRPRNAIHEAARAIPQEEEGECLVPVPGS